MATCGPAEEVGMLTYAAACELGATKAQRQVVLGDGADWIKTQANEHFPDALKVLDWPHLWRKIRDAMRALQPGNHAVRRAWRKEQYEVLFPLLWQGERQQALTHLQSLRPSTGEAPALEDDIRCLETQRDWMGNYQRWQEQGYPVGSCLVERAVAVVINVRVNDLRSESGGLHLDSTATQRIWQDALLWLPCPTHQGTLTRCPS